MSQHSKDSLKDYEYSLYEDSQMPLPRFSIVTYSPSIISNKKWYLIAYNITTDHGQQVYLTKKWWKPQPFKY